jgi:hypothetical protein
MIDGPGISDTLNFLIGNDERRVLIVEISVWFYWSHTPSRSVGEIDSPLRNLI